MTHASLRVATLKEIILLPRKDTINPVMYANTD